MRTDDQLLAIQPSLPQKDNADVPPDRFSVPINICNLLKFSFQFIPDIAAKTDLSGYTKDDHYTDTDCLSDDSDY